MAAARACVRVCISLRTMTMFQKVSHTSESMPADTTKKEGFRKKGGWPGLAKRLLLPIRGRREEAAAVLMSGGIDERDGHMGMGTQKSTKRRAEEEGWCRCRCSLTTGS